MLIHAKVIDNFEAPKNLTVETSDTVAQILSENGVNYSGTSININGRVVRDPNQTLDDLGITEDCRISLLANAKNA
ncbi:MAG: hypothetical protein PUF04_09585 [bacterium]|nr:hypothetical protein [bacterium]